MLDCLWDFCNDGGFDEHSCLQVDTIRPAIRRVASEVFAVDLIYLGYVAHDLLQIETDRHYCGTIETGFPKQIVILRKNLAHLGTGTARDRSNAAWRNTGEDRLHHATGVDDSSAERKRWAGTEEFHISQCIQISCASTAGLLGLQRSSSIVANMCGNRADRLTGGQNICSLRWTGRQPFFRSLFSFCIRVQGAEHRCLSAQ